LRQEGIPVSSVYLDIHALHVFRENANSNIINL
jgi:hypothetical protein